MNDSVADREDSGIAQETVEPLADDMEGGIVVGGAGTVGPARFSQNRAVCALSDEVRVGPDAFDLPDREHADRVRPGRGLDRELDAAGSGVEDEDAVAHCCAPDTPLRSSSALPVFR